MVEKTLIAVVLGLLAMAAWRDVATRLIPDGLCLTLFAIAVALRAPAGWPAVLASLGAASLLFLVLFVLAMRGFLGGGDVKLAGALAAGLPPAASWDFVVLTIFAGGILGTGYIAAARLVSPLARPSPTVGRGLLGRVIAVEAWRVRRRGPLPYAVAIAGAGAAVLLGSRGS